MQGVECSGQRKRRLHPSRSLQSRRLQEDSRGVGQTRDEATCSDQQLWITGGLHTTSFLSLHGPESLPSTLLGSLHSPKPSLLSLKLALRNFPPPALSISDLLTVSESPPSKPSHILPRKQVFTSCPACWPTISESAILHLIRWLVDLSKVR